ncbi:hypothetical protein [Telluribacter sp. SYSU D00476]|uniref:hypothetical protein n=1 Tax=Telluribacter sp. SYSU D00476 TaxID=2811430 RepID=UPI001FF33825|nr:hypothetical protein [Telluribacter sp. SYSU D00476]
MKNIAMLLMAVGLMVSSCTTSSPTVATDQNDRTQTEEQLNNRRLERNLERYAEELDLSKRQVRRLKQIERKYDRKERRLANKSGNKRRAKRELQEQKNSELLSVLNTDQQEKLKDLSNTRRPLFKKRG